MKKDILFEKVTGVNLAIARKLTDSGEFEWSVYIINKNLIELKDVLIVSKGYGTMNGEDKKTSALRHYIKHLDEQSYAKVEPIDPALFGLNNEFWVSYYILNQIFDKKFVFVANSITDSRIRFIPELELEGVLHA
jgi:hypothetical protein